MKKKILSAFLAGTMALSLTACGGSEKPAETTTAATTAAATEAATEAATDAAVVTPDGATGTVTLKLAQHGFRNNSGCNC